MHRRDTPATMTGEKRVRMTRTERERQLLDIAEELFATQGVSSTSIEDIARAAGVTRPMLYDHFGDRDAVLLACARRARAELEDRFTKAVEAVAGTGDLGVVLEAGGDAFFALLAEKPHRWALLYAATTAMEGPVAKEL